MSADRFIGLATILAALGAILSFFVGLGAGLSENPNGLSFWVLAAIFTAIAGLCDAARRRM